MVKKEAMMKSPLSAIEVNPDCVLFHESSVSGLRTFSFWIWFISAIRPCCHNLYHVMEMIKHKLSSFLIILNLRALPHLFEKLPQYFVLSREIVF